MKRDHQPDPLPPIVGAPAGDHPIAADHLARGVLRLLTAALSDIRIMTNVHADMAPASANHVNGLAATVAGETLAWLERWPS